MIAAPAVGMRIDVGQRALLERLGSLTRKRGCASGFALRFQRIGAISEHTPIFDCLLTRSGQGNVGRTAHADVTRLAATDIAEHPSLGVPLRDLKIAAVTGTVSAGLCPGGNLTRAWKFSHGCASLMSTYNPIRFLGLEHVGTAGFWWDRGRGATALSMGTSKYSFPPLSSYPPPPAPPP